MSTTATTTLTGLSDIVKFNRGEITPTFIPPVSCLETPTSGSLDSSWYIGHFRSSSYDSACYPSSTAVSLWDLYYCEFLEYHLLVGDQFQIKFKVKAEKYYFIVLQ